MALDTADIKLITGLQSDMEGRIMVAIKGVGSGIRAKMESEVDRIDELDQIRNGRIGTCEDNMRDIKRETRVFRWAHRNPKVAIITVAIFVASVSIALHTVGVKRAVDKLIRIELNEGE